MRHSEYVRKVLHLKVRVGKAELTNQDLQYFIIATIKDGAQAVSADTHTHGLCKSEPDIRGKVLKHV